MSHVSLVMKSWGGGSSVGMSEEFVVLFVLVPKPLDAYGEIFMMGN